MIRKLVVLMLALSSPLALASDPLDLILTDSGVTVVVRGTGEYVCSGHNSRKDQIPYLGRGLTMMEAKANVMNLLASRFGGSTSNEIIRCERSNTGRGRISMSSTSGSWRITVEGPAQHQCITEHEMKRVFFVANAGTLTEAEALSIGACQSYAGSRGTIFCKTACQKVAGASGQAEGRGRRIGRVIGDIIRGAGQ